MPPSRAKCLLRAFADQNAVLLSILVFLVVSAVFFPCIRNDFVNYDDPDYVTSNPWVQRGLTWQGVRWAATSFHASNWHPLTWLSHMLDCQLFGLKAWGHHSTNVLLHAANAALVFVALRALTGAPWRSLFVALLFGLHPLRVQSVAWVAERKDVLCAFFCLLTIWAYAKFAGSGGVLSANSPALQTGSPTGRRRSQVWFGLALVFFALALLSKPMAVTLPFVLLLLDYWPLKRWELSKGANDSRLDSVNQGASPHPNPLPFRRGEGETSAIDQRRAAGGIRHLGWRPLLEKLPFFVLAAATAAVTFFVQEGSGAMQTIEKFPVIGRIENALVAYETYLGKFIYPVKLAVFYPHPGTLPIGRVLFAAGLLLIFSAIATGLRRKQPWLLIGWLWFLGTMVPVIGVVQVGAQAIADRYTYLPLIGIALALTWSVCELACRWRPGPIFFWITATAVLIACIELTRREISYWSDSETLFRRAVAVTQDNTLAHFNLGFAIKETKPEEALAEFETALKLLPGAADLRFKVAGALMAMGHAEDAITQCQASLGLQPGNAEAELLLGRALESVGRLDQSIAHSREAIRRQPDLGYAHSNLGLVLAEKKQFEEAIRELRQATKLLPESAETHDRLGWALGESGQLDESVKEYREAVRLKPDDVEARNHLGFVLLRQGNLEESSREFRTALKFNPNYAAAHLNLAIVLHRQGNVEDALKELQETLRIEPNNARAQQGVEALQAERQSEGSKGDSDKAR